jgi:hypothetical protein
MNREDILKMGRQAGSFIELAQEKDLLWLERFATLVASAEREACAQVAQDESDWNGDVAHIADLIRARGQA